MNLDILDNYEKIKDDPVRPHLTVDFRTSCGREVYCLKDKDDISAVICVAYTNHVPVNEYELDKFSQAACQDEQHGSIAVFYTVWSYAKGAGRKMVLDTAKHIKKNRPVKRFVTLSPKTEMARKFHLSNGAVEIQTNSLSINYEYPTEAIS